MTKVKMQKVEILAEFDCNTDGREVGCRDQPGERSKRCHRQTDRHTNQPTSGKKKQDSGPPREMNEIFLEV